MDGAENGELKKLAGFVEAGFKGIGDQLKEVNAKLNLIEKERAFESGFEVKEKVKAHEATLRDLHTWKTATDNSLNTAWWFIKILIGAIVALIGALAVQFLLKRG